MQYLAAQPQTIAVNLKDKRCMISFCAIASAFFFLSQFVNIKANLEEKNVLVLADSNAV